MTENKLVDRPLLKLVLGNTFNDMSTAVFMFFKAARAAGWSFDDVSIVMDAAENIEEHGSVEEAMALLGSYCENGGLTVPEAEKGEEEIYYPDPEEPDEYEYDEDGYDEDPGEFDPEEYGNGDQYSFDDDGVYEEYYPDQE